MNYSMVFKQILKLFVVWCFTIYSASARNVQYPDDAFYNRNFMYNAEATHVKINLALQKLEHTPQWEKNWPDPDIHVGQVSGLALDGAGQLLVFHRHTNVWDDRTFNMRNVYQNIGELPIAAPTVLVFNDTGHLVDKWGQDLFHMPHGITVDHEGNVWLTDVALHQVFKFLPGQYRKPDLVLGEKFLPGTDDTHFCKPSAVAVLSNGDFFVADGYCNHRILKFSADGQIILQWGKAQGHTSDPFVLNVPHALTLAEDRGAVCVADRERGRVACYRSDNGTFISEYSSWLIGSRLFSVAYTPAQGGLLYVVNGPYSTPAVPVRGYVIEFLSGRLVSTFAPDDGLRNPHDVVVSRDGSKVYVAEINPYKVHKFVREPSKVQPIEIKSNVTHGKPTAIVEASGGRGGGATAAAAAAAWRWGLGGAGGAAAAALLALAALALLRARNQGRNSMTRRRWEYGQSEFKIRRLLQLERRRFTRVHSDDSDDEPAPMLPRPPATA